jgi:PAS domain S-box-containing protein
MLQVPSDPRKLEQSEAHFRSIFDSAAVGMGLVAPDGRWLQVNRSLCEIVGRSESELLALTFQDITHPEDLETDLDQARLLLAGKIPSYAMEKRYLHKDGRVIWVLLSAAMVPGPSGAPRYVLAQIQDITDRQVLLQNERRGRIEADLERSRLASLFAQAPAFMCTLIGPRHVVEFPNAALEQLVGRDLRGLPIKEGLPELRGQGFIQLLDRVLETGKPFVAHEMRVMLQRAPGPLEERFVTMVYQPMTAPDGSRTGVFVHGTDVTDHVRATEALQESEMRFRQLAEHIDAVFYLVDTQRQQLFYVSPAYERVWGRPAQEVYTNPLAWRDSVHPDDRERVFAVRGAGLGFDSVEYRIVRPTGDVRWIRDHGFPVHDDSGRAYRIAGIAEDITEQRRAAEQLIESEQRFRSLVDNTLDAVVSVDLEGRFLSVNPGAEVVSGFTAAELLGKPFIPLIVPEHAQLVQEHFQLALGGAPQTYEMTVLHKSGSRIQALATNVPIVVAGRVVGVFGVIKDVTVQRSLEEQLRQAQKMEAVGRLAGGIAHDFNNLLTAILSNTELVLGELPDGPVRQDVEVIRQTAERASGLTRQLLAFSRKQVIQPRLLDLSALVYDTERMLRRTLGEGIVLETDLRDTGSVLADPGQLEQVLVNLAVNARDAMPDGGTLTLRTREVVVNEVFAQRHRGLRVGAYVALDVEDSGVGMDAATQTRIFEPFFTTKEVGKGTGLGLATVYGIVKQVGGYVAVESAPGKGAAFTIYLPRQEGQATRVGRPADRLPGGTETILVVEDEASVRNSIKRILTRQGYTVLEARHGADALQVIDETRQSIDLVMTDLMMPEMGGRELVPALQALPKPPRVVVMSGYDEQAVMGGKALPSSTSFLEKPFTVEGVLQAVRAALDAKPGSAP